MRDEGQNQRLQQFIIALAAAARFSTGILMGTALAVYVGERGSPLAVSLVLTAYFLGMTVFSPIWGAIADVTGRRRLVLITTGALATVAVLPLLVVKSAWAQVSVRALYSVFAVGFVPVMLTIMSQRGGDEGRGRSVGFFNSARAIGFTSGQVLAGVLLGLLVPQGLFLVIAGISLLATLAVVLVDDPTPTPETDPTFSEVISEVRRRLLPARGDREHLKTNGLRWLYVGLALRNMTVLGVMSLMPPYLINHVGVSEIVMGVILAMNPAGQTAFMYVFGHVADGWGRKPLITLGMAGSGLFGLVGASATLPEPLVVRALVAVLAFILIAASFSSMTTGAIAFIGDVSPKTRESELMGLRSTAKGVGGVLGPPLFGVAATLVSYEAAFAFGSVFAFLGATLVLRELIESHPKKQTSRVAVGDD